MRLATLSFLYALFLLLLGWGSVNFLPETAYYPRFILFQNPGLSLEFFLAGQLDKSACDKTLFDMRAAVMASCPTCTVESQCSRGISELHRRALGNRPLSEVSLRMKNGTLLIHDGKPAEALTVCNIIRAQRQDAGECTASGAERKGSNWVW